MLRCEAPRSGARKASAAGAERSTVRWTTEIVRRGSPGSNNRGPTGAAAGTNRPLRQGSNAHALGPKAPITFLGLLPWFVPEGNRAMSALTVLGRVLLSEPSPR
ncbi:hypothetical protein ACFRFU_26955 [Streptomyces sp. NPDC056704]|uniref:hypothetical protein n=1 Tax=Streptomyces sp. NPDC056704 TaxID=3345917 RepID=UPI0036B4EEDB